MSSIEDKVKSFVVENFLLGSEDDLDMETSFLEEGIIDSTGVLELVEFLQKEFKITVDDDDLIPENLDSISRIVAYLNKKG